MVMITVVITGQLKAAPPSLSSSSCRNPISARSRKVRYTVATKLQILLCQLLVHVLGAEMVAATKPFEQFQDLFMGGSR